MSDYNNQDHDDENPELLGQPERQPAFNVPTVILILVAIMTGVHLFREYVLSAAGDRELLLSFAFFPVRFDSELMVRWGDLFPDTVVGPYGTFVTYGLIHGDWIHLIVNGFWLLVFGSALARRFGAARFLLITVLGTIAGAGLHLLTNFGSSIPVVGASAAISAHMACAARFAFVPYGPLGRPRSEHPGAYFLPSLSILEMLKNTQAASFLAIWFAVNLLFGLGSGVIDGQASIAWEAHIGGFLAGLFLFPILDPARNLTAP
ncbi:MAG: rhomboid family intramembrane serine protease [Hyphomicrobiales bacterium]